MFTQVNVAIWMWKTFRTATGVKLNYRPYNNLFDLYEYSVCLPVASHFNSHRSLSSWYNILLVLFHVLSFTFSNISAYTLTQFSLPIHLFIMMMGTKARFREKCQFNFKGKWENCCLWCCFLFFLSSSHLQQALSQFPAFSLHFVLHRCQCYLFV